MKKLEIYADSRCNKAGLGAYCFVVRIVGRSNVLVNTGSLVDTTAPGAELHSVVEVLEYLHSNFIVGRTVSITIDSQYVFKGITQWLEGWVKNNWKSADKSSGIKNLELWQRFHKLSQMFNITWTLVSSKHDAPLFLLANEHSSNTLLEEQEATGANTAIVEKEPENVDTEAAEQA